MKTNRDKSAFANLNWSSFSKKLEIKPGRGSKSRPWKSADNRLVVMNIVAYDHSIKVQPKALLCRTIYLLFLLDVS